MADDPFPAMELELLSTVAPSVLLEDLDEFPSDVADAILDAVTNACHANSIPVARITMVSFRDGRVAEVTLRLD